ncbi:radial spoke head 10 b-related [Holotrichia oblita]|uniref:Radial spoke head 10 b-related n=1 Tax=Holotrichia oblita TaxID=644536 RepID=A0ACB9TDP6_HOLOL|nr:radial spoke head 10 b-related [Holotrichia oblita]
MNRAINFGQRHSSFSHCDIRRRSVSSAVDIDSIPDADFEKETVLLFYNSMLPLVVDEWKVLEEEVPESITIDVEVKDFKEITQEDLGSIATLDADGSKVLFNKKRRGNKPGRLSLRKSDAITGSVTSSRKCSFSSQDIPEEVVKVTAPRQSIDTTSSVRPLVPSRKLSTINWFVVAEREYVRITFKNGNIFQGYVNKKKFDGKGTFTWSDGTVYEGEFVDGEITGQGKLYYKDNSTYSGSFCKGLLSGNGTIYIACTTVLYSGDWKKGKQSGKGWALYEPDNWYEGEWLDGKRHGKGLRQYNKNSRYQGTWQNGKRHGQGTIVWSNSDCYSGEWKNGVMDGYGEYIWKANFYKVFIFPLVNSYEGEWMNGLRSGMGVLHFGFNGGARMAGQWIRNMKHGAGVIVCGNGKTIKGNLLFMYDKPVDAKLFTSTTGLATINKLSSHANETSVRETSFQVPDKLCPNSEEDLDRMNLFSEFPISYSSQSNPLRIPVHSEPKTVDLTYYLKKVSLKYGFEFPGPDNVITTDAGNEKNEENLNIIKYEEKKLRFCITYNYLLMQTTYLTYAKICAKETIFFRSILVRIFLWQLYLDAGVTNTVSLIDTDLYLLENPDCGLESEHNPFEKIYFWQFIYSLISVAWALYSNDCEDQKENGILATVLTKFLTKDIEPNLGKCKGGALCEYVNILPISNVYLLYRSVGEPHTVRIFVSSCLSKLQNLCEIIFSDEKVSYIKKGTHAVIGQVKYMPIESSIEDKPSEPTLYPFKEHVYESLRLLRKLKPKDLIECIASQCPQVMEDDLIVNMDYNLSFLEFYNILIASAIRMMDNVKKHEHEIEILGASSVKITKSKRMSLTRKTKR